MADRELRTQLGLYRRLLGARMRADWQYRGSFFLLLTASTLATALDLAVIAVLFSRVDALAGWSGLEVALLYGLGGVAFALSDVFVSQVESVADHIKAGTFDQLLLRPVWPLLQLSAGEFALRRVGRIAQAAVVLAVALAAAGIHWTPGRALLVPLTLASGTAVFSSIWVVAASLAFWTVETQEVGNAFTYGGNHLVQYPIDVLGAWLRWLATFVVPLAFVAYYPAAELLGKRRPAGAAYLAPAVAGALVLVARAVWRGAVRRYRSTGS